MGDRIPSKRIGTRLPRTETITPKFGASAVGATSVTRQMASEEAIRLIAGVLEREAHAENLTLDNSTFAAQQFLHMVIALPQRRAMGLGTPMTSAEVNAWAGDVVNLFLNGCRGWEPARTQGVDTAA